MEDKQKMQRINAEKNLQLCTIAYILERATYSHPFTLNPTFSRHPANRITPREAENCILKE